MSQQGTEKDQSGKGTRMPEQHKAKGQKKKKKHLYLLFDDWHSGYSLRKVSLSRRSGKRRFGPGPGEDAAEPLPLPAPLMRIQADRGYPQFFEAAFGGTKILAMHPGLARGFVGIPVIDVEELNIEYGPEPTCNAFPIYFPVGDNKLFIMDIASFDYYLWRPEHSEEPWMCDSLPDPPFEKWDVTSYGVHPDGFLIVSTKGAKTFIYDTKEYVWGSPCVDWAFPFTGRGHYDTSMEGFVGLSKDDPETLGYLFYCSSIIGTGDNTLHPCPDFKRSKEKVFNKNPAAERHVSATLVHMRPGRFCLVECVSTSNGGADQEPWGPEAAEGGSFMYRLKTFTLEVKGDLKLENCRVRCFKPPEGVTIDFLRRDPPAFWL